MEPTEGLATHVVETGKVKNESGIVGTQVQIPKEKLGVELTQILEEFKRADELKLVEELKQEEYEMINKLKMQELDTLMEEFHMVITSKKGQELRIEELELIAELKLGGEVKLNDAKAQPIASTSRVAQPLVESMDVNEKEVRKVAEDTQTESKYVTGLRAFRIKKRRSATDSPVQPINKYRRITFDDADN